MSGLTIWFFLSAGLIVIHAHNIYISGDGRNDNNCGWSMNDACKTIDYVLVVFKNVTIITLNGGDKAPMRYYINEEILLSVNLTFNAFQENRFLPVITQSNRVEKFSAFTVNSSSKSVSVIFNSIEFLNLNIVACKDTPCRITLYNCTVRHSQAYEGVIKVNTTTATIHSTVDIQNSTFHVIDGYIIDSRASISITINNTFIEGGGINHFPERSSSHQLNLTINKVVFTNKMKFAVRAVVFVNPNINIKNSIFQNVIAKYYLNFNERSEKSIIYVECGIKGKCKRSSTSIVIDNTVFINCFVQANLVTVIKLSLKFMNSIISNNTLGEAFPSPSAVHVNLTSVVLYKVMFSYNIVNKSSTLITSVKSSTVRASLVEIKGNKAINARLCECFWSNIFFNKVRIIQNSVMSDIVYIWNSFSIMKNIVIRRNNHSNHGIFFQSNHKTYTRIKNMIAAENVGAGILLLYSAKSRSAGSLLSPFLSLRNVTIRSFEKQKGDMPVMKIGASFGRVMIYNLLIDLNKELHTALQLLPKFIVTRFKFFDTFVSCPIGSNPDFKRVDQDSSTAAYTITCNQCAPNLYTLNKGNVSLNSMTFTNISMQKHISQCKSCPNGGECSKGRTKSRGYFYGFKERNNTMKYIPCPTGYCCSTKTECISYDTCAINRFGVLCGRCQYGYQENLFSKYLCIRNESCNKHIYFWVLYFLSVSLCTIVIIYLDIFPTSFKKFFKMLKNKLKCKNSISAESSDCSNIELDNISQIETATNEGDQTPKIEKEKNYTLSGIFSSLISYYQIKSLLTVAKVYQNDEDFRFFEVTSKIFNMDLLFNFSSSMCPMSNTDAVNKRFIKHFLFNLSQPLLILLVFLLQLIIKKIIPKSKGIHYLMERYFYNKNEIRKFQFQFKDRVCVAYIRTLLLIYKNLSFFALTMIHCVSLSNNTVMFIQGNRECYQRWQYSVMVFLGVWIIPFPFALWQSYILYIESKRITYSEMLFCITFPIILPFYLLRSYFNFGGCTLERNSIRDEKIEELFTESYRKKKKSNSDHFIFWEHWRLIQRLLLASIATFVINPLEKSCYFMPVILLFLTIYFKVLPYKPHLKLLHWCEVVSLVSFCFIIAVSIFDGFFFTYNISEEEPVPTLRKFFVWMDVVVSPVTLLVFSFVIFPIGRWVCSKVKEPING